MLDNTDYDGMTTQLLRSMYSDKEAEKREAKKIYDDLCSEVDHLNTKLCYRYLLLDHGLQRGDVVCRTKTNDYGEQRRSYWLVEGAFMRMVRTQRGDNRKRSLSIYAKAWRKDGKRPLGSRDYKQETFYLHRGIETDERLSIVKDEAATAATIVWEEKQEAERLAASVAKDKANADRRAAMAVAEGANAKL